MSLEIRPYRKSDFEEIYSWWEEHNEPAPIRGMMVEDGTFVVEWDGKPVMTLTAFMTQSLEISHLAALCSKPGTSKEIRSECISALMHHCVNYLIKNRRRRFVMFADKAKLVKRYQELGLSIGESGLTVLGKEI